MTSNIREKKVFDTNFYYTIKAKKDFEDPKLYISPLQNAIEKNKEEITLKYDSKGPQEKIYISYGNLSFDKLSSIWKQNNSLYEIIQEGKRKAYFDIDKKFQSVEDWNNTLKALQILLLRELKVDIFNKEKTAISEGKGTKEDYIKISAHIVINDGYLFENQKKQREFMLYLKEKVHFEDEFKLLRGGVLDFIPYGKNQAFKLPYQSKVYKNIVQIPKDGFLSCLSSFIVSYNGENTKYYDTKKAINTKEIKIKTKSGVTKTFNFELGGILRDYKSSFPSSYKIDIKQGNKNEIDFFLQSIPNSDKVSFSLFQIIGYCLRRVFIDDIEKGLQKWVEWTTPYKKVFKEELRPHFEGFRTNSYGLNTLRKIASIFNKYIDNDIEGLEYLFNYKPPYDCEQININKKYIDCEEFDILKKMKKNLLISIKSPMGSGKSYTMKRIFEAKKKDGSLRYKSILYLSNKRAFACSMSWDFVDYGFKNYIELDKKSIAKVARVVCSIESIKYCRDKYDLVIIDESESIADNMSGEMLLKNNPIENLKKFHTILNNSKRSFFMDAYLGQRTFNMIEDLNLIDKNPLHVENSFKNEERKYSLLSKENLTATIRDKLNDGKRCVLVSGSSTFSYMVKETLIDGGHIKNNEIKFYSQKTPLELGVDVNQEWSKCRLLIYTPTITSGISYDNKEKLFDNLFIYAVNTKSCIFRDTIQAHKRVRHFKDKKINIVLNSQFKGFNRYTMARTLQGVEKLNNEFKNKLFGEDIQSFKDIEALKYVYKISLYNKLERDINSLCFDGMAKKYLDEENIKEEKNIVENEIEFSELEDYELNFNKIRNIGELEAFTLKRQMEKEKIDEDQVQSLIKFHYIKNSMKHKKVYCGDLEDEILEIEDEKEEIKKRFFDKQFSEKLTRDPVQSVKEYKKLLYEIKYDFSKFEEHPKIKKQKEGVKETYERRFKRYEYIFEIMNAINLIDKDGINIDNFFSGEDFNKLIEKYKDIDIKTLNFLFKDKTLRRSSKEFGSKQIQSLFNTLLKDEFSMCIQKEGVQYKKVDGKRKKLTVFRICYNRPKEQDEPILDQREYNAFNIFNNEFEEDKEAFRF